MTVGDGVATPSLVGDRLYVFSREDGYEVVRCLEAPTGKELWKDQYESLGASGPASGFSGPRATPTVADDKVLTFGVRGTLSAFDATSGKLLWRKQGKSDDWPRFYTSSSPIIVNNLGVVQLGGESGGAITAFDLATGDEKWTWSGDGTAYASPVAMKVGGDSLIVTQTAAKVVALKASDGSLVWETPFVVQGRGYNTATPIVTGNTIIYSGSGRGTTAVKLDQQGDQFVGTELWSNQDNSVQFSSPILAKGLLFGISSGNEFFCLKTQTGQVAWAVTASGQPVAVAPAPEPGQGGGGGPGGRRGGGGRGGGGYGSLVDADSVVFALTPTSELIAFEPTETAYTELARIKVAPSPTYAYPVVSGRRVFIKDQDSVALLSFE